MSQKDKNKYHILMHIYGIQKDHTHNPMCKASKGDTDVKNTFGLSVRRRWDDLREQHRNIYITVCKIDNYWESDTGQTKPLLCNNLEGWGREGVGRMVQGAGDKCMPMANSY